MVKDIVIACFKSNGGLVWGDIVACRNPINVIGKKEVSAFFWFRSDISNELASVLTESHIDDNGNMLNKRRFRVKLKNLKNIYPHVDVRSVVDINNEYQPYLDFDNNYFFKVQPEVIKIEGLKIIWDKKKEEYI